MQAATRSRLTLACILVTILLDMIGVGIIVPVLPELLEDLTGGSVANAAVLGGYLVFTYAFMQFVFSPVLGNLSDRFGRRPVLLMSLLGLTFDYLMMSIAPVVWYLFIGRIIAGVAGAAVATARQGGSRRARRPLRLPRERALRRLRRTLGRRPP